MSEDLTGKVSPSEELRDSVSPGEVLASVKTLHGAHVTLSHYEVERATTSVQGFTSLMLRVTATVKLDRDNSTRTSIIIKRLPVLEGQADLFSKMNVFEKEVMYFNEAVPVMLGKVANLPLPRCLYSHGTTLIMEDLCESGYKTLAKTHYEIIMTKTVTLPLARLVMRKLAILHTASLNVTWSGKLADSLKTDTMFESTPIVENIYTNNANAIVEVIKVMYPDKGMKYAEWLGSKNFYETMTKFTKAKPNSVNVLNHGDCWVNNIMFKVDPITNQPYDLKFIDLQIYRFASPVLDILNFLYICTSRSFRDMYENELLKVYADAFNVHLCETPDRLPFEKCRELYEEHRMFGLGIALTYRPMMLLGTVFPQEDQPLSSDNFDSIIFGDHTKEIVNAYKNDVTLRSELTDIVDELISVMDRQKFV